MVRMSDPSIRQPRSGQNDYSRNSKSSTDPKGSPSKRSNMSPGEKASNHSSRFDGSNSYHDHQGRHTMPFAQTRHSERDDYHQTQISGRNSTGSSHSLPLHKDFDSSHSSGSLNRPPHNNRIDNSGQIHSNEMETNASGRKFGHFGDRNIGMGSRGGYNYSNISQKPSYNHTQSEDLTNKSSESNRVNFPSGHPNHDPHLPPPNPFSNHPKSSSLSSSQSMSKPSNEKYRQYSDTLGKESIHNHRDSDRRHERLPPSTSVNSHTSSFHDDQRLNKSSSKYQDHEIEKNHRPDIPQFNSSSDYRSQSSPTKPMSTTNIPFHERISHGSYDDHKSTHEGHERLLKGKALPAYHKYDVATTNVRPTTEFKSGGYPPNGAKPEQSRRLISESKDILSDGSDSDVLVIDMGDNEDKKAGSNKDEKIKSDDSGEPFTTNKSKNMEKQSSSENEKTQNSSRSGPHEDTGSHNHKGKSEGKLKQSPSKSSHDTSSSSPKKGNKDTNGHDASKPEKFDQVEDALEAMFGLDEGSGFDNEATKIKKPEDTSKGKDDKKQKKKPTPSSKKSESKVVAKSLTMTKVQSSEKSSSGSQKKGSKRKIEDNKEVTKKPGRPRLNSNATESVKGKRRNSAVSEKKTSSTFEHQNGKTACDDLTDKYKGPHIRVEGNLENPSSVSIVNSALDSHNPEDHEIASNKRKKGNNNNSCKVGSLSTGINDLEQRVRVLTGFGHRGHHTSTLSSRYDPKKLDPTWICVFCHQGSHHSGLGDLFGPYFVSPNVVDMPPRNMSSMGSPTYIHPLSPSPSKSKQELAVKFIIGEGGGSKKKRHRKASTEGGSHMRELQNAISGSGASSDSDKVEVWFHEDCIAWMSDVRLVGHVILGLEDAISSSRKALCFKCNLPGSTLGCISVGCRELAHFHCAKEAHWAIDEYNFQARCSRHKPSS